MRRLVSRIKPGNHTADYQRSQSQRRRPRHQTRRIPARHFAGKPLLQQPHEPRRSDNANQAAAYNALYTAQQAYNTAHYYYSLYSQAPTQNQKDQAQANLDLANATLKNAQVYLAALTSGTVPADASGTVLLQLTQDQLAVQTAQANLNASELTAPFDGTIMDINISSNQVVGPETWDVAIADTCQWFVDTSDLNEQDVV